MTNVKFKKSRVRKTSFTWPDKWIHAILNMSGFNKIESQKQSISVKMLSDYFLNLNDSLSYKSQDHCIEHAAQTGMYGSDSHFQAAYAGYYLPVNIPKIIDSFELSGITWNTVNRILDIGTGPGTALLGSLIARKLSGETSDISLAGLDHSPGFLSLAQKLVQYFKHDLSICGDEYFRSINLERIIRNTENLQRVLSESGLFSESNQSSSSKALILPVEFDLLTASNVVSELSEDAREQFHVLVDQFVRPGGFALLLEPARKQISRCLEDIRNRLIQLGWTVLYPCPGHYPCPMLFRKRDWCHHRLTWTAPDHITDIDRLTGMKKNLLNFSVFVLRKPESARQKGTLSDSDALPRTISAVHEQGPEHVIPSVTCRVVSDVIHHKGRFEVYLCGYFSQQKQMLVASLEKKHVSDYNRLFMDLARYDQVHLENATVRGDRLIIQQQSRLTLLVNDGAQE